MPKADKSADRVHEVKRDLNPQSLCDSSFKKGAQ